MPGSEAALDLDVMLDFDKVPDLDGLPDPQVQERPDTVLEHSEKLGAPGGNSGALCGASVPGG